MTPDETIQMLREALHENQVRIAAALQQAIRLDVSFVVRDSLTAALESMLAALSASTPRAEPTGVSTSEPLLMPYSQRDLAYERGFAVGKMHGQDAQRALLMRVAERVRDRICNAVSGTDDKFIRRHIDLAAIVSEVTKS